jgi:hypothetical protein
MTQHTPGDWYITGPNIRQTYTGALLFVQENPFGNVDPDPVEQAANRRLVAASPVLLAAAKVAVGYMQWHTEVCPEPLTCPEVEAYRQLVAAIALAGLEEDSDGG